jgi:hypothetical protein
MSILRWPSPTLPDSRPAGVGKAEILKLVDAALTLQPHVTLVACSFRLSVERLWSNARLRLDAC